ncbi:hypothetical protein H0H92_000127 [Tricholoma furcatifolium]|nr:hypothetical protein H0H92_000127 [Tricholoma furcatifolium]
MTTTRLALLVRLLIALSTRTFFQPDEYLQSLEPAYNVVFGNAHLTWEWLAPNPIRSVLYPALNIPVYWLLKVSGVTEFSSVSDWLLVGSTTAFAALFLLDSLYYGQLTSTPLNFLRTNLSAVSLFYGVNTWHYYLSQALPILCTTALPFVLHGMWISVFDKHTVVLRNMMAAIAWCICVYSFAEHKEWRFIHPILPLLHVFAAKSLVDLSDRSTTQPRKAKSKPTRKRNSSQSLWTRSLPPIRRRFLALLCLNIPVSIYIVLFYCSAPISLLGYIRSLPTTELDGGIGFLMPCHSTPGHAYLHRKQLAHGKLWALGCEPPLQGQNLSSYRDQTDVFFAAPLDYFQTRFPSHVNPSFPASPFPASIPGQPPTSNYPWVHEWPSYLVFFGALLEQDGVQNLLEAKGYGEVWRKGRTWEGEGKRRGAVRVWKWRG